jgi:hypothetical protein
MICIYTLKMSFKQSGACEKHAGLLIFLGKIVVNLHRYFSLRFFAACVIYNYAS